MIKFGGTVNDRLFLLEKILTLMAWLGKDSEFGLRLQQLVIGILYKDLPHPPSGYLALPNTNQPLATNWTTSVDYPYRSADGSNYNPLKPFLGMAGLPYARTVSSQHCQSPAALPPAELVFDTLLKRDEFVPHPGGMSSLFFAFADIIIHNIFHTDERDWTKNKTNSYLDLSPLYGTSQEAVNRVRKHDGTGKLHNDVFADARLIFMPPAVCALLVLLSRNHNYVAEKLLSINERGTFKKLPISDYDARERQDEEIFQRARLVNTGYFVQIILRDYVGAILGLVRDGSPWRLDPLMDMRDLSHEVSPRGEGNAVSIEFNLLYRWHAAVSDHDRQWTERLFDNLLPGVDMKTISLEDFKLKAMRSLNPGPDVQRWEFGGIKRGDSGRFDDADLARILQDATAASASAFKARGTPEVLRVVELLGIEQARSWGTCTLNEFRKFMGLKPYGSFPEWNKNKEVAAAAEALYHDIDNLELYVGMQAEEAKVPMPGAGLCPGYTISRAILADAVALTRGDRFLTVDFTPYNLTTWGYGDCQANTADGSYGGMLTKLLFRHLPDYYPESSERASAYAHFPFLVPERMREFAREHRGDIEDKYYWDRPRAPAGPTIVVKRYSDIQELFAKPTVFTSGAEQRLRYLGGVVSLNTIPVQKVLTSDVQLMAATRALSEITERLIRQKKLKGIGPHSMYLDIVRDVINLLPVHWLSTHILGLPLKTQENPHGTVREQELYGQFANIANYVYRDTDPENEWFLREQSRTATLEMLEYVKGHLTRLTGGLVNFEGIRDLVLHWVSESNDHSEGFLRPLVEATGSRSSTSALDDLACSVFASVVPTAAIFSQIIAHVVDFYLGADKATQRAQIVRLVEGHENARVMPFVFEAIHVQLYSVLLSAQSATSVAGTTVARGQHILASIIAAERDPSASDHPDTPNYAQSSERVECVLGLDRKGWVAPLVLSQIFKLKNLIRQPTQSGRLAGTPQNISGVPEQLYCKPNGSLTPLPVSLVIQYGYGRLTAATSSTNEADGDWGYDG
ncbi:heme peroxidase [Lactifluus subvellereus]|nr:heme peroxidase [Lactifluus subvellereus]